MEFIDRDLLLKDINESVVFSVKSGVPSLEIRGANKIIDRIKNAPTADVAEVKHGYNKTSMHPVDEFWCSECGFCCADYTETKYDEEGDYTYSCECEFDYCPRCGAKIDKEGSTE